MSLAAVPGRRTINWYDVGKADSQQIPIPLDQDAWPIIMEGIWYKAIVKSTLIIHK